MCEGERESPFTPESRQDQKTFSDFVHKASTLRRHPDDPGGSAARIADKAGGKRVKIKEGSGWKAGYNERKGVYGAEVVFQGDWDYYEISAGVYDSLTKGMRDSEAEALIRTGRHLYSHVNDRFNPPYTIVFDENYADYCPWTARSEAAGEVWDENLTDAAVELFESEKANREQRRKKRGERSKREK